MVQEEKYITSKEVKINFKELIQKHQLHWKVIERTPQTSKISVEPEQRTIYINQEKKFFANDLIRFLVHEIGIHVLRAENGSNQPYKLLKNGLFNSLSTEEGLASYIENQYQVLDNSTFRLYAGRVLAVFYGLTHSFYDTFQYLQSYLSQEEALYIIARIKRGLTDTSENGVYTKDYVYLKGFYKVENFLKVHDELPLLYIGAIGIQDIPIIKQLLGEKILKPAIYLPKQVLKNIM